MSKVWRLTGRYRGVVDASIEHAETSGNDDVEFFGIKLKVNNPRLATLLNSNVNENVVVIGRRTVDLLARADDDADGLKLSGAEASRPD